MSSYQIEALEDNKQQALNNLLIIPVIVWQDKALKVD